MGINDERRAPITSSTTICIPPHPSSDHDDGNVIVNRRWDRIAHDRRLIQPRIQRSATAMWHQWRSLAFGSSTTAHIWEPSRHLGKRRILDLWLIDALSTNVFPRFPHRGCGAHHRLDEGAIAPYPCQQSVYRLLQDSFVPAILVSWSARTNVGSNQQ